MYLRHATRVKDGKAHTYWRLVRSVRMGRKVVQQTVAHLGELDAVTALRAHWGFPVQLGEIEVANRHDQVSFSAALGSAGSTRPSSATSRERTRNPPAIRPTMRVTGAKAHSCPRLVNARSSRSACQPPVEPMTAARICANLAGRAPGDPRLGGLPRSPWLSLRRALGNVRCNSDARGEL